MACDIGPYYSPTGEIKSGYDHPLDIGPQCAAQDLRRRNHGVLMLHLAKAPVRTIGRALAIAKRILPALAAGARAEAGLNAQGHHRHFRRRRPLFGDLRAGGPAQYPAAGEASSEGVFLPELRQLGRAVAFQLHRQHPDRQLAARGRFRIPAARRSRPCSSITASRPARGRWMPGRSRRTKVSPPWAGAPIAALGQPYGANVVLPKQLLLEAVQDVVKKGAKAGRRQSRERVCGDLKASSMKATKASAGRSSRRAASSTSKVRETLVRGLIEYINGPEAPTSGDELTFFIAREVMREFAPRLMLVNFWDMDVAHWGSYSLYLNAITRPTGSPACCGTRCRPTPTTGTRPRCSCCRNSDATATSMPRMDFLNHRSGDPVLPQHVAARHGRRRCPAGETERPVHHVDVAATAAELLGVKTARTGRHADAGAL